MREHLIELLKHFRFKETEAIPQTIDDRYGQIADYLIENDLVALPRNSFVLTKAEVEALTQYDKNLTSALIERIFLSAEELLQYSYRLEDKMASACSCSDERGKHLYGRGLCERLLIDLVAIKRKYAEERRE